GTHLRVDIADALGGRAGRVVAAPDRVDRRQAVQAARFHALQDVFFLDAGASRDLARRRRGTQLLTERGGGAVGFEVELLDAARDAHRPAAIAEVTLEFADDRGHRERGELESAIRLEALDRLQEADQCNLAQVVEGFAAVYESTRQELGEAHVLFDE